MAKLMAFIHVSLDGYFTDENNDMSIAHNPKPDAEWEKFSADNASGDGVLLFGRKTYELMASFWPTPAAKQSMPEVAEGMNNLPKVVFSRTLKEASWNNTRLVKDDLAGEVRRMKEASGSGLVILGSGSIVSQLTQEGLIDEYQIVVNPVVLGKGRSMFEGVEKRLPLKLTSSRSFDNGNTLLTYEPAAARLSAGAS